MGLLSRTVSFGIFRFLNVGKGRPFPALIGEPIEGVGDSPEVDGKFV